MRECRQGERFKGGPTQSCGFPDQVKRIMGKIGDGDGHKKESQGREGIKKKKEEKSTRYIQPGIETLKSRGENQAKINLVG